ncbi:cohesin domain-containing protein [Clostridium gasigenes]|uniref:cohesin domain-containing protein n=1 Tax=Clostridium gasigenes TaxID=94869 RepID=UPI001C0C6DF9|nr:cohesin domain-containing protein [Clostridium gasigenes]MBU3108893.1 cohesin domain-containing protein [Clostridium gasigenes]
MKKILGLLIGFIIIFSTTAFAASEPTVSFTVDGKVKKGEKITINIMAKDVSNLYALSADYIYNPEFIKVNSIEGDSLIKDSKYNLMEPGGQVDKDGNRANYQMTFTGKVNGVSGSGAIVKIEAEVLKDFTIELTEENMKVKLVKVDKNYNVNRMNFVFNDFKIEGNTENSLKSEGNTENSGSTSETTDSASNEENSGGTSGETPSEENTNGDVTASEETESEISKPSFIEKIMNIFKKEPEVKESSNVSESTNLSDKNKDVETTSDNGEISKADNEESVNNDENIKVDNKQDVASKSNALAIVLTTSIVVIATLVIRKKHNNYSSF